MKRLGTNAALLALSVMLTLGAAELVVRFVYRDVTTTTPIDSWFGLRWKQQHLRRNSHGYRDREFSPEKRPGTRRMIVIGDSITAAMGLPEEDRYPNRIERALAQEGASWEVLQFASPGHELNHHLRTLRDDALPAHPDFVLLQWYPNDFELSKAHRQRPRPLIPIWALDAALYRHSALYTVLTQRWLALQVRWGLTQDYGEYMHEEFGDPDGAPSRRALEQLDAFFAMAALADVPVGVVLFPYLDPSLAGDDYPFGFLHDRVLASCELHRVTCVDLRPVFAPYAGDIGRLRLNSLDRHASAFAHQLAADALLEVFGPIWRRN